MNKKQILKIQKILEELRNEYDLGNSVFLLSSEKGMVPNKNDIVVSDLLRVLYANLGWAYIVLIMQNSEKVSLEWIINNIEDNVNLIIKKLKNGNKNE
jgi:hypothetical protein